MPTKRKCNCPCGTNPIAIKGTKAKFCHERIKDPKKFDPKSFRTKVYRAHRITFGCPQGKYSKGVCKVPVQVQAILHPVGEAKCPAPGAMIKKNPFLETSLAIATGITVGEAGKYVVKKSGMLKNPRKKKYTFKLVYSGEDKQERKILYYPSFEKAYQAMTYLRKKGFTIHGIGAIKKNPGAKWHEDAEIYNDNMESKMRKTGDKDGEYYYKGKRIAHQESKRVARKMGMNPMYHGRAKLESFALRLYKSGQSMDSVVMELKKKFDVPSSVAEYIAKQAAKVSRGGIKDNPEQRGATKIYDRILTIEAKKGKNSNFPNENFRHDFSSKDAEILGMPDGSLKIRSKTGKRLWKNFNYPEKGGKARK